MISFAPQDLFARSWSGSPFAAAAPHAPFIGSFHPQIAQGLASSYASSPWLGSSFAASPWLTGSVATSPWTGSSINPIGLAFQAGLLSPYAGLQNFGIPFNAVAAGGIPDLTSLAIARQQYLPGFYPSNFIGGAYPAMLGGNLLAGTTGFHAPAFTA